MELNGSDGRRGMKRAFLEMPEALDEQDEPKWISPPGDVRFPPLVEVAGGLLPLIRVVKPPDPDTLWEWYALRGQGEADPSWASVWPAAAALAGHIAQNPVLVRGLQVVELGAGLGIAGLSAAMQGAHCTLLVDREPLALHCAMSTALLNGLTTAAMGQATVPQTVCGSVSDWAQISEQVTGDIVLGAEVLHDPEEVPGLAHCSAQILRGGGTLLITDPLFERVAGVRAAMKREVEALGATVTETLIPVPGNRDAAVAVLHVEFPAKP